MVTLIEFSPDKTYATKENALKAVQRLYGKPTEPSNGLRFLLTQNAEGRWFPVFLGERAVLACVHRHFCVAL